MIALSQRRCNPHRRRPTRKAYSFARAGSLWVPKGVECSRVSMAFSPALADLGTSGDTPLDWPGASSLLSWYHWRYDRQFSSTLYGTGAVTPPPVTFTGSVPLDCGLRLDMPTGGVRGTAQFRWSARNGDGTDWSAPITTAASVNLGNGITLQFANTGSYATDNDYRLVITSWNDQTGHAHHWIPQDGSLAKGPTPRITPYGTALSFDQAFNILKCTTSFASSLVGGTDNSFHIVGVFGITSVAPIGSNSTILFFGDGASNHCVDWFYSGTQFKALKTDDTNVSKSPIGTTSAPTTSYHIYELFTNTAGTAVTMMVDGTAVTGINAADFDVGALTVSLATIGKSFLSGAEGNQAAINWLELATYTSDMDATTRGDIRSRMRAPYGI